MKDREFLKLFATELGAVSHDVALRERDGVSHIEISLDVATDGVPAPFSRLVGRTVRIEVVRSWAATRAGFRASQHIEAASGRNTARIRNNLTLTPIQSCAGTRFSASQPEDLKVDVPIIGRLVRTAITRYFPELLEIEVDVLRSWIRRTA